MDLLTDWCVQQATQGSVVSAGPLDLPLVLEVDVLPPPRRRCRRRRRPRRPYRRRGSKGPPRSSGSPGSAHPASARSPGMLRRYSRRWSTPVRASVAMISSECCACSEQITRAKTLLSRLIAAAPALFRTPWGRMSPVPPAVGRSGSAMVAQTGPARKGGSGGGQRVPELAWASTRVAPCFNGLKALGQ